jgi:hypothetical protein
MMTKVVTKHAWSPVQRSDMQDYKVSLKFRVCYYVSGATFYRGIAERPTSLSIGLNDITWPLIMKCSILEHSILVDGRGSWMEGVRGSIRAPHSLIKLYISAFLPGDER